MAQRKQQLRTTTRHVTTPASEYQRRLWREAEERRLRATGAYAKPVVCEVCRAREGTGCGKVCVRPCVCSHEREVAADAAATA